MPEGIKYDRDYHMKTLKMLEKERSDWDPHWKEVGEFLYPQGARFLKYNPNDGRKRHQSIIDSTPGYYLEIMSAGLKAGISNPATRWFRVRIMDEDLMQFQPVKAWLWAVADIMENMLAGKDTDYYRILTWLYKQEGAFGNGCAFMLPNFQSVFRVYPVNIGQFYWRANAFGQIDSCYRRMDMTVEQIVSLFPKENIPASIKHAYDRSNYYDWHTVVHAVEPRRNRRMDSRTAVNMPWLSHYYCEKASRAGDPEFLSRGGFETFPVLTPRWTVEGNDVYGWGPGMVHLGDIKQLQDDQVMAGLAKEYMLDPPLQIPTDQKNTFTREPGAEFYHDQTNANGGIRTAWEVQLDTRENREDIFDVRQRLAEGFRVTLFQMVQLAERSQVTAREVEERHEEKLILMGPVLESNHNDPLGKSIDLCFEYGLKAGLFPPPPEELSGQELRIEFVSLLAQAQKRVGIQSQERFLGTVFTIEQMKPGALAKVDLDKFIDEYAEMNGVNPDQVVPTETAMFVRAQQARAQQAVMQAQQANVGADTVKKLAEASAKGGNRLDDLARAGNNLRL